MTAKNVFVIVLFFIFNSLYGQVGIDSTEYTLTANWGVYENKFSKPSKINEMEFQKYINSKIAFGGWIGLRKKPGSVLYLGILMNYRIIKRINIQCGMSIRYVQSDIIMLGRSALIRRKGGFRFGISSDAKLRKNYPHYLKPAIRLDFIDNNFYSSLVLGVTLSKKKRK